LPKYLGYAHFVEYPPNSGKLYERGQNIPNVTKSDLEQMRLRGHSFEPEPEPEPEQAPDLSTDGDHPSPNTPRSGKKGT
jgi:hypothetical protein